MRYRQKRLPISSSNDEADSPPCRGIRHMTTSKRTGRKQWYYVREAYSTVSALHSTWWLLSPTGTRWRNRKVDSILIPPWCVWVLLVHGLVWKNNNPVVDFAIQVSQKKARRATSCVGGKTSAPPAGTNRFDERYTAENSRGGGEKERSLWAVVGESAVIGCVSMWWKNSCTWLCIRSIITRCTYQGSNSGFFVGRPC